MSILSRQQHRLYIFHGHNGDHMLARGVVRLHSAEPREFPSFHVSVKCSIKMNVQISREKQILLQAPNLSFQPHLSAPSLRKFSKEDTAGSPCTLPLKANTLFPRHVIKKLVHISAHVNFLSSL